MKWLVITDLDGSLLDLDTYAWQPARPALDALAAAGIPVVLNSSKTRAEIDALRRELGHDDPFIVENGAALFVPRGATARLDGGRTVDGYPVVEWGTPYGKLLRALRHAAQAAAAVVRGFHEMSDDEVAARCGLPLERARLARRREYDEPFVVLGDDPEAVDRLDAAVRREGLRLVQGGRFCHLLGRHDKAAAARAAADAYRRQHGTVRTIALGDAPNDLDLLRWADVPIILDSRHAPALSAAVPAARVAAPGPEGWNRAILDVLATIASASA